jgi:cytochrome d ubiquinol oxidase subunit II
MQTVWYVLIGVLLAGYAVLDGFDLGVGSLYPFLGRDEADKRALRTAVGPFWDGNEVWLLTGGGALFAAFPIVYATVFSGMTAAGADSGTGPSSSAACCRPCSSAWRWAIWCAACLSQ